MSTNLRKYLTRFEVLAEIKSPSVRQKVIQYYASDKSFCSALREIMKNVRNGNISLNKEQKRKLRKHEKTIAGFLKVKLSAKQRRRLVVQSGSGILLPLLIPLVIKAVSAIIEKAQRK